MKKLISWLIAIFVLGGFAAWFNPSLLASIIQRNDYPLVKDAWARQQSNLYVEVEGTIMLNLPDMEDDSTYQQFLVVLQDNHRVLVSHDVAIAKRVPIVVGNTVRIRGEYDWTPQGGLIHWTHRDPSNTREGGWIDVNGKRFD